MKVDGKSISWLASHVTLLSAYLPPDLSKRAAIALYGSNSSNLRTLGSVHKVLEGLWSRMSESQMPNLGGSSRGPALGPCIKVMPPADKCTVGHLFWYILNDKLVISINKFTNNCVAAAAKAVELHTIVPPVASFLKLTERHQVAWEVLTVCHITKSNCLNSVKALGMYVHIPIALYKYLLLSSVKKVAWFRRAVIFKTTTVMKNMYRSS